MINEPIKGGGGGTAGRTSCVGFDVFMLARIWGKFEGMAMLANTFDFGPEVLPYFCNVLKNVQVNMYN